MNGWAQAQEPHDGPIGPYRIPVSEPPLSGNVDLLAWFSEDERQAHECDGRVTA